jgi:GH24 family phage-related lysozyme (muramidase)
LGIGETITRERADKCFEILYLDAVLVAHRFVGENWDSLSDNQKSVVTDMVYNLGNKIFTFVKLRKAWQGYDLDSVRREMINSKWYAQVGNRSKLLVAMV